MDMGFGMIAVKKPSKPGVMALMRKMAMQG